MASLPTETLDLGHSHPLDADLRQRIAHIVEAKRFHDRRYELH
jgi:hypothetical protein